MSFPLILVHEIGVLLGLYLTQILKPKVFQSSLLLRQKLLNLRNRLMRKSRPCSLFRVSQSINLCQKSQLSRPIKNFLASRQKLSLFLFQIGLRSQQSYQKEIWKFCRKSQLICLSRFNLKSQFIRKCQKNLAPLLY